MVTIREDVELIEERVISGRGLFNIPPSDSYRHFWLYIDLIRYPRNDFDSQRWNPSRSDYAKITWSKGDYIYREDTLHYANQVFQYSVDPTGYLSTAISCMYVSLYDYLVYLSPFVSAPPLPPDPTNRIYMEPIYDVPDKIRIVCRGDAAIGARLYRLNYDYACPEGAPTPKKSEPPIPTVPFPEGTSITVSPPYDGVDDNGDTIPNVGDELPPYDPCADVGYWAIEYTIDVTGDPATFYIRGKETDVFAFTVSSNPVCTDGEQQDLSCNGELAYSGFACTARALDPNFVYMGLVGEDAPDGIEVNQVYPTCT